MICLGFVTHPDTINGKKTYIESRWLTDKKATWSVNIAGRQVPAKIYIHPPKIPMAGHYKEEAPSKPKPGHAPIVDLFKKDDDMPVEAAYGK